MAGAPPPPYYGLPQKKSNTTTIVLIVLGVCALCCVLGIIGFVGLGWMGLNRAKSTIACTVGFEEAALAMQDYVDDHNGKLPPADKWQDDIRPYFSRHRDDDMRHTPKMFGSSWDPKGDWTCKDENNGTTTGIAFNSDLGGMLLKDVKNPSSTFVLFEVPKTGSNLNMPYEELTESSSPKIMGSPRGWLKVDAHLQLRSQNKHINVSDN